MSEQSKNKALLSGTVIYAIGSFGTKILTFLIVPLYTYYISTAEMGAYDLLLTTVNLLIPLVTLAIYDAAYRWMIGEDVAVTTEQNAKVIAVVYQILAVDLVLCALVGIVGAGIIRYQYAWQFAVILFGNSFFNTVQKMLRGVRNQKLFALSGIAFTVIVLSLNVLQVCILKRGVEGMLLSLMVAYLGASALILIAEKRVRPVFVFKGLADVRNAMIKYALPLIPNQLNWWIMTSSDRYIVKAFLGNDANGIYSISYKFPTLMQTIFTLFTNSFQDVSVGDDEKDQGEYYTKVFDAFSVAVFTTVMLAIPVSKLYVKMFMSAPYHPSADYIGILYLGSAFQVFSAYYGVGYLKNKNTNGASSTSIYGALINIIVNLVLIKFIGLYAAAVSTAVGFFAMWIMRVKQAGHVLGVRLNAKHLAIYGMLAIAYAIISVFANYMVDGILFVLAVAIFIFANRDFLRTICSRFLKK